MRPRPPLPQGPYLIVGLARSGLAAALALRERGEQVLGFDAATPPGLEDLANAGVELGLGGEGLSMLERVSTVVKSPGIPAEAPVILAARARGLQVIGELELAWRLLSNEFIAVTGTNGKTTTVELIGHIHRTAGLPVALAGNLGIAASTLIASSEPAQTVVCETSSFQLEDTIAFAPEAAVLLNITPDHLDRHGSFDAYRAAKLKIFALQSPQDLAVAPLEFQGELRGHARRASFAPVRLPEATIFAGEGALWWRGERLQDLGELRLRGAHNVQNAMAAALVCLERGLAPASVAAALASFPGVPHRLEEVARLAGVLYVNDSKATNLASTLVALAALSSQGPIHLILGGQAKGQSMSPLREHVQASCVATYVIGEDAPQIERALAGLALAIHRCGDLDRAVAQAAAKARPGEVVLLSPGCASFDQFSDFEERGERFRELVGSLPQET